MTIKRSCRSCGFSGSGDCNTLICRRYAKAVGGWPTVNDFDWCGEYQVSDEAFTLEVQQVTAAQYIAEQQLFNEYTPSPLDWRMEQCEAELRARVVGISDALSDEDISKARASALLEEMAEIENYLDKRYAGMDDYAEARREATKFHTQL